MDIRWWRYSFPDILHSRRTTDLAALYGGFPSEATIINNIKQSAAVYRPSSFAGMVFWQTKPAL